MIGLINLEWLNLNSQRNYPLADFATSVDQTGAFTLPTDFLLSLYFPVNAGNGVDPSLFYLQQISVFATGYVITIGYNDGVTYPAVASTVVAASSHVEGNSYALPGLSSLAGGFAVAALGGFDDSVGQVVVGRLDSINLQPPGTYTFAPNGGALDTDCIRPTLRGVSSLIVVTGNDHSARIYGDVELTAGDNVRFTTVSGLTSDGPFTSIRIDALSGENLSTPCVCAGAVSTSPPITSINGVPPDASGAFHFSAGQCISVTTADGVITLADTCSKPCCGCEDLSTVMDQLTHMGDEASTLKQYVASLKNQVDTMGSNVLSSRLGDAPCLSC